MGRRRFACPWKQALDPWLSVLQKAPRNSGAHHQGGALLPTVLEPRRLPICFMVGKRRDPCPCKQFFFEIFESSTYSEGCWNLRLSHTFQVKTQDPRPDPRGIDPHFVTCTNESPLEKKALQHGKLKIFKWAKCGPSAAHPFPAKASLR